MQDTHCAGSGAALVAVLMQVLPIVYALMLTDMRQTMSWLRMCATAGSSHVDLA